MCALTSPCVHRTHPQSRWAVFILSISFQHKWEQLLINRIRIRLQEPKSHHAVPYYMEKDNSLSVKTLSKKASPSVSRNITTADLCSVKVLMEDITTGCFLILLCWIAHTFWSYAKRKVLVSSMLERKFWRLKICWKKAFSSQKYHWDILQQYLQNKTKYCFHINDH